MNKFLSQSEIESIEEAIRQTEKMTSAEIVVCIKKTSCVDPSITDPSKDDIKAAVEMAAELKLREVCLGKTKDKNGVVILISPEDRKLAVCGDKAVSDIITDWPMVTIKITAGIRKNKAANGINEAIQVIGHRLKKQFPIQPDDVNEIPNRVIFE